MATPNGRRPPHLLAALLLGLGFTVAASAEERSPHEKELQQIQQQMEQLQRELAADRDDLAEGEEALKALDLKLGEMGTHLNRLQRQISEQQQQIKSTSSDIVRQQRELKQQRLLLARQIRAAYANRQSESLKLLLNQEDPARLGRIFTYYHYFNNARTETIAQLKQAIAEIDTLQVQHDQLKQQNQVAIKAQQQQMAAMEQTKQQRQATLAKLKKEVLQESQQLKQLQQNEKQLQQVIQKLTQNLDRLAALPLPPSPPEKLKSPATDSKPAPTPAKPAATQPAKPAKPAPTPPKSTKPPPPEPAPAPIAVERSLTLPAGGAKIPFKQLKGKLRWPTNGKLSARFGSPREVGGLKWQGVVIQAKAGTAVRAVSRGQVIYADWLRGYGLLLIIDHGGGYMSLYGHNQAIYKKMGDRVNTDEVIAEVGSSGNGSGKPSGLYFEIRYQGTPTNPNQWCKRF